MKLRRGELDPCTVDEMALVSEREIEMNYRSGGVGVIGVIVIVVVILFIVGVIKV